MPNNIDRYMSRLNERLMSCAQRALDDMNNIAEQRTEREDIRACIEEIKTKNKKAITESWATANHWSEHFNGLGGEDADCAKEEDSKAEQEETTDGNEGEE
ncbi:MAG: hypothetical protein K2L70_00700 [Clostridia bacterium]|nr:hypothetical protein [Clostridia bacterium]